MCGEGCDDKNVPAQTMVRVIGGLTLAAGVIQLIYTCLVYAYMTNVKVGGWWAAIFTVVTGALMTLGLNKGLVLAGLIFSIFGMILCAIAMIVDGIAYGVLNSLKTCVNTDTGVISGEPQYTRK